MSERNAFSELFPGLQRQRSTENSSASISTDFNGEKVKEGSSMSNQSLDTQFLLDVLSEFERNDKLDYRAKVTEHNFYLSELYAKKTSALEAKPVATDDLEDFHIYNKKVQREYVLRKKMDNILLQRSVHEPLEVLSCDNLSAKFTAGKEDRDTELAALKKKGNEMVNFLFSPLRPPTSAQRVPIYRIHSNDTQVIDLEHNAIGGIDEPSVKVPELGHLPSHSSSNSENKSWSNRWNKLLSTLNGSEKNYQLQRKLDTRHLQAIAIGATIGVGLFLNSGKALSIGGPFGTLIGFSICGSIVLATMLSFTELATLIPISSGVSGLASRFVEDAFGFALGWTYWLTYALTFANQIVASNYMLSYYTDSLLSTGATAGFITLFLITAIVVNLMDVRLVGEVTYGFTFFKILVTAMMIIVMVVLNAGAGRHVHPRVGFRYWDASKSPGDLTYGLFRPTFDLRDQGAGSRNGIPGSEGRFLSILVVLTLSSFSYSGVEVGFVACGEAINPRRSLPSATKKTFVTIIILYLLSIFVISLNVYSGDSGLLRYYTSATERPSARVVSEFDTRWQIFQNCSNKKPLVVSDYSNGSQSPWVLALKSFGLCSFSSTFNAFLVIFGVSSAFSSLYSASRTLYAMGTQDKAPASFRRCSRRGVPYVAVAFSGLFGTLAYLALSSRSLEFFQVLANISGATISIIWLGLNVSFLRFYYALKKRPDIISRSDPSFPYRSPFQPFTAYYGLTGSVVIMLLMGFVNFLRGFWSTKMVFSCYGGLLYFGVTYLGYKLIKSSKIQRLDQIDLDTGRREMDRMRWIEHREYTGSWRESLHKLVTWLV
ncbi:LAME_0G11430g1_1 [Lachancea meyersii CBS 8951]|uniref:LAME_0G11430g1_1 n=1 Tax=Lachancea meyersii CBS 8951 TaxID=1266667 RepID=A0A1G4K994_9SACH|nr:LAME_0G11430g1_1 [Lachancea meyersii CBS 8951]